MTAVQSIELLQDFLSSLREEGVDPLKFILALGHLKPKLAQHGIKISPEVDAALALLNVLAG